MSALVFSQYEDADVPDPDFLDERLIGGDHDDGDSSPATETEALAEGTKDPPLIVIPVTVITGTGNIDEELSKPATTVKPNCSKENDVEKRKQKEEYEKRFKDSFTWDLKFGDPCGPEKRCNFLKGLVCATNMTDGVREEPMCDCDVIDTRHSQWSPVLEKCSGMDFSDCFKNNDCASNSCLNGTCGRDDVMVEEQETDSLASSSSVSLKLFFSSLSFYQLYLLLKF